MKEYGVERVWRDMRLNRIGAGTDEIMLDVIGRSYGLTGVHPAEGVIRCRKGVVCPRACSQAPRCAAGCRTADN